MEREGEGQRQRRGSEQGGGAPGTPGTWLGGGCQEEPSLPAWRHEGVPASKAFPSVRVCETVDTNGAVGAWWLFRPSSQKTPN